MSTATCINYFDRERAVYVEAAKEGGGSGFGLFPEQGWTARRKVNEAVETGVGGLCED